MYLKSRLKETCTGCRACEDICPKNCISMQEDKEGFVYPVIDDEKCIHCHLCEKVCPGKYGNWANKNQVKVWAGVYNSEDVIHKSSSGGAFTAIYEHLLKSNYTVYGVVFDENFKVKHAPANSVKMCESFRKSKYVLSDTNNCYQKIQQQLQKGEKVLFTGTPCQCAALLNFLELKKVNTCNLITIDLICHGAPNQALFNSYLRELEDRENSSVKEFLFKNKTPIRGKVNSRSAKIVFTNGKTLFVGIEDDPFLKAYYSRLFYRPSCKVCSFARPHRVSDLTLGDAWGIKQLYPQWDSLSGVSLILVNSDKGKGIVDLIKNVMILLPVTIDWAEKSNQQLHKPTDFHQNREKFFLIWRTHSFYKAVKEATKTPLYRRALGKIKCIIKQIKA